jgi:uncharacterized Rmd1/YagE family protein
MRDVTKIGLGASLKPAQEQLLQWYVVIIIIVVVVVCVFDSCIVGISHWYTQSKQSRKPLR